MLHKKKDYIPYTIDKIGTTTKATAHLLFQNVWKLHNLSSSLTSGKNPQFILEVWKNLCKIFGISANLLTSFHPETDGQSEIAN